MSLPNRVVRLTGGGRGAIASLLVEGEDSLLALKPWFEPISGKPLAERPIDAIVFGSWGEAGQSGEETVVTRRSATRIEIHCHGGATAAQAIIEALKSNGCEELIWKDWIQRSTDDLISAEAQIALASTTTERAAAILLDQFRGALRRELERISKSLEQNDLAAARERLFQLDRRGRLGLHLNHPWLITLAGRANVGKSSLINALVGYDRAIVMDQPGTTRDIVTVETAIDGWPVELADTAGLRDVAEQVEQQGVSRARRRAAEADLLVLVFDASATWNSQDAELLAEYPAALVVHNKIDMVGTLGKDRPQGVATSAVTGEGVDCLIAALGQQLVAHVPPPGGGVPFNLRQVEALSVALEAVEHGDVETARSTLRKVNCR